MNTLPESDAEWLDRSARIYYQRLYADCTPDQQENLRRALALRGLDLVAWFKAHPATVTDRIPGNAATITYEPCPRIGTWVACTPQPPALHETPVPKPPKVRTLAVEVAGDYFKQQLKPKIRLEGQWLARLGFPAGSRVQVLPGAPGELTLRAY